MRSVVFAAACAAAVLHLSSAQAQGWPNKPVRVVVPFAAGGAADVMARLVSDSLSSALGQQFVVENRAGGGGLVAAQTVARLPADGYALMTAGMSSHVLAPAMSKAPGFDPVRDFTQIAYIGGAPSVILVHPSLGVRSIAELVAAARARAEGLEYVSSGAGTVGNMLVEALAAKEKVKVVHVAYRSGNAAIVDLIAGRVKLGALNWSTAGEHVRAGTLIPVAVSSAARIKGMPDLPTLAELGYAELVTTTWHALAGPAGLPAEVVEKANRAVIQSLDKPELRKTLDNDAVETRVMTPAELKEFFAREVAKWAPVVKATVKTE